MLDVLDSLLESTLIITFMHIDLSLSKNWSRIYTLVYQMHSTTSHINACRENVPVRMGAREVRKQRRMDVDQATLPAAHEPRCQYTHLAAEHYQLNVVLLQRSMYQSFVSDAPLLGFDFRRQGNS